MSDRGRLSAIAPRQQRLHSNYRLLGAQRAPWEPRVVVIERRERAIRIASSKRIVRLLQDSELAGK